MILVKPSHKILALQSFPLELIELAGRTCYKSEDKITDSSAKKFVKMVIERGHHSVIEHVNVTVKFICDRGITHEIVRHRLAAYSQESTRYCNYKGGVTFIIPPWITFGVGKWSNVEIEEILREEPGFGETNDYVWINTMLNSERTYIGLLKADWSPQQARSVLPNSLKTEIVMTANVREWRHIFDLRCSKAAHPQMRELMIPLQAEMRKLIPVIFD